MAPKLERFVSPGKGNGLRATGRILKGELVFSAEPLANCVSKKVSRDVCHHCFTRCETLLRCSQCKMARYCNITCQKQAWSVHKTECKCLRSLLPRIPTDSVRLAARLIFALVNVWSHSLFQLFSYSKHKSGILVKMSKLNIFPLSLIFAHSFSLFSIFLLFLHPIFISPSGPVCPSFLSSYCFLFYSLSLLNHDCRPNCVMVFEGTKLQLRAVREINPEEELTISYIETLSLTEDRQRQLEEQYHFTCHCQRCGCKDTDGLMVSGEEVSWRPMMESLSRLDELKAESNWQVLLESCKHLLSAASSVVPDENLYKLRVTDAALDACIHLGYWEEALGLGLRTLPVYRQYYPDPHPVHGVQLMRVGKLQHYLEHISEAADTFKQAYQIIKVTHGDTHSLTKDLLMKMEECRAEIDQQSFHNN
uniref:[histone H3]-lysine(4) N-trimethyltransferase n=1 Tax=Sphaeramia orbicularis TaxID=375764 RepID=A0A673BQC2_9TELE